MVLEIWRLHRIREWQYVKSLFMTGFKNILHGNRIICTSMVYGIEAIDFEGSKLEPHLQIDRRTDGHACIDAGQPRLPIRT